MLKEQNVFRFNSTGEQMQLCGVTREKLVGKLWVTFSSLENLLGVNTVLHQLFLLSFPQGFNLGKTECCAV